MRYKGELYFDDGDVIEARSFIIRDDREPIELFFDIVATWSGQGRWRRNGELKLTNGFFTSDFSPSQQVETGQEGPLCKLTFKTSGIDKDFLSVVGKWVEQGVEYPFGGDLEVDR